MNSIPTLDETDGLAAESTLLQSTTCFISVQRRPEKYLTLHTKMSSSEAVAVPRKLWEHEDPESTPMWKFMQDLNGKHKLGLKVCFVALSRYLVSVVQVKVVVVVHICLSFQ